MKKIYVKCQTSPYPCSETTVIIARSVKTALSRARRKGYVVVLITEGRA